MEIENFKSEDCVPPPEVDTLLEPGDFKRIKALNIGGNILSQEADYFALFYRAVCISDCLRAIPQQLVVDQRVQIIGPELGLQEEEPAPEVTEQEANKIVEEQENGHLGAQKEEELYILCRLLSLFQSETSAEECMTVNIQVCQYIWLYSPVDRTATIIRKP